MRFFYLKKSSICPSRRIIAGLQNTDWIFPWFQTLALSVSREKSFCFPFLLHFASKFCHKGYFTKPTIFPKVCKLIKQCQFPFKTFFNFPDVSPWYELVIYASRFNKAACLVCASSALSGAHYVAFSLVGRGRAGEQGSVPPPNAVSHKGTIAGGLWSLLSCTKRHLALTRTPWMVPGVPWGWHGAQPLQFCFPLWYLFTVGFC